MALVDLSCTSCSLGPGVLFVCFNPSSLHYLAGHICVFLEFLISTMGEIFCPVFLTPKCSVQVPKHKLYRMRRWLLLIKTTYILHPTLQKRITNGYCSSMSFFPVITGKHGEGARNLSLANLVGGLDEIPTPIQSICFYVFFLPGFQLQHFMNEGRSGF